MKKPTQREDTILEKLWIGNESTTSEERIITDCSIFVLQPSVALVVLIYRLGYHALGVKCKQHCIIINNVTRYRERRIFEHKCTGNKISDR